eukprot:3064236-Prymnesium_polylepis.2
MACASRLRLRRRLGSPLRMTEWSSHSSRLRRTRVAIETAGQRAAAVYMPSGMGICGVRPPGTAGAERRGSAGYHQDFDSPVRKVGSGASYKKESHWKLGGGLAAACLRNASGQGRRRRVWPLRPEPAPRGGALII